MYIAVCSGCDVLEVSSNEAASLEGMRAYSDLGYRRLRRVACGASEWLAWACGRRLVTDLEVVDGRPIVVIVEA